MFRRITSGVLTLILNLVETFVPSLSQLESSLVLPLLVLWLYIFSQGVLGSSLICVKCFIFELAEVLALLLFIIFGGPLPKIFWIEFVTYSGLLLRLILVKQLVVLVSVILIHELLLIDLV